MNNPIKLFIVEGENRDYRFVTEMTSCFFGKGRFEARVINLPASQNIYMLYQLLKADDFDTDIVEILRDSVKGAKEILDGIDRQDIDEVYLFFDYDIHQNNLPQYEEGLEPDEVLRTMLEAFDNETENGKLYISYPMVEALYDYRNDMCETYSGCVCEINNLNKYKETCGKANPNASAHFAYSEWAAVLKIFPLRLACLWEKEEITFDYYRRNISPLSIFLKEKELKDDADVVFVLSAFPEFLFDYFKIDFWNSNARLKKKKYYDCMKMNSCN